VDIERRFFDLDDLKIETRADSDAPVIRGHAAVFNKLSENLGGFREQIAPGAFDDVLNDDVRALFNHDPNHVLGRTKAGTLSISVDDNGLAYEVDPPDTQTARDLIVSMQRGDVSQSSFAFTVEQDDWSEDEDGRIVRTIQKVKRLYDVSPVTYPAYPDASVGLRSLEAWKEQTKPEPVDYSALEARLRIAEIPR
jgi:HK97 family phage prohead protease